MDNNGAVPWVLELRMPYSGNPDAVARFKSDMQDVSKQLAVSLEQNYLNQADELMANMRGAVPVGATGALKASIRKKNVSQTTGGGAFLKRVSILVLAGGPLTTHHEQSGPYDYALATEFGTQREKAEPFFYSTARRYQQQGRASAAETVDQAIAENNRVRDLRAENYSNSGASISVGGRGDATVIRGSI